MKPLRIAQSRLNVTRPFFLEVCYFFARIFRCFIDCLEVILVRSYRFRPAFKRIGNFVVVFYDCIAESFCQYSVILFREFGDFLCAVDGLIHCCFCHFRLEID